MAPIQIRPAEPRDAGAIAEVHTLARRTAMPYLPDVHSNEETRRWVAQTVLPRRAVWVAEAVGRVVGVTALDGASVEQLYVLPTFQGRGVGSALLAKANEASPDGLSLWTFQRNAPARAFYERRGFVAAEFGDGSGNEEGEPDARYTWTPGNAPTAGRP